MTRDYAGAAGRIKPELAAALDHSRFAFQQKEDGVSVDVLTDGSGRLVSLRFRTGAEVSTVESEGLLGLPVGLPDSVLHGELNSQTEAAQRDYAVHGPRVRLFDISVVAGCRITSEPYQERFALLNRWQAAVECEQEGWTWDRQGQARSISTGLYHRPVRRNLKRFPILPIYRGRGAFERARADAHRLGWEGLVAVNLEAPLGARGSKLKWKDTQDITGLIVAVGRRAAIVSWKGYTFPISCSGKEPKVGELWDLKYDGWMERRVAPKFPRLVRPRPDLGGMVVP